MDSRRKAYLRRGGTRSNGLFSWVGGKLTCLDFRLDPAAAEDEDARAGADLIGIITERDRRSRAAVLLLLRTGSDGPFGIHRQC